MRHALLHLLMLDCCTGPLQDPAEGHAAAETSQGSASQQQSWQVLWNCSWSDHDHCAGREGKTIFLRYCALIHQCAQCGSADHQVTDITAGTNLVAAMRSACSH